MAEITYVNAGRARVIVKVEDESNVALIAEGTTPHTSLYIPEKSQIIKLLGNTAEREQGFIEESLVCDLKNGSGVTSKEEILKQLQEQNVSCKDVTFKIFGLSLTTYNIVISVLITINTLKIYLNDAKSN